MDKDTFFEDHGSIEKRENSLYGSLETLKAIVILLSRIAANIFIYIRE